MPYYFSVVIVIFDLKRLIITWYGRFAMADYVTVAEAKKMRSGINLKANVKKLGEKRTVSLKSGEQKDVCDHILADDSGDIKLTLWGDDISKVKEGDVVVIDNGYTKEFRGDISISAGKFGKMLINPGN